MVPASETPVVVVVFPYAPSVPASVSVGNAAFGLDPASLSALVVDLTTARVAVPKSSIRRAARASTTSSPTGISSYLHVVSKYLTPNAHNTSLIMGDQGYGRGGTPIFTVVFEPLARVAVYVTDEIGLGTCFGAA